MFKRIAVVLISIAIIASALVILDKNTRGITLAMVAEAARAMPAHKIVLALFATLISFCTLGVHEIIAVRAILAKPLPLCVPGIAGIVGNAFGNTLGFHAITITAWRYRVYSKTGLSIANIAGITGITVIGMALGFASLAGIALVLDSQPLAHFTPLYVSRIAGAVLIIVMIGALITSKKRRQIGFGKYIFCLPDRAILLQQLGVGLLETSAAAFTCYVLLPANATPEFAHFAIFYIAAVLFGIVSHTPGGLGVFEAGMMTVLKGAGSADILAALLLYRVIYNLVPFGCACFAAGIYELRIRSGLERSNAKNTL